MKCISLFFSRVKQCSTKAFLGSIVSSSFIWLISCGSAAHHSNLSSQEESQNLFSVIMAGSDSCRKPKHGVKGPMGASMYPNFTNMIKRLQTKGLAESAYIISCYTLSGRLMVLNSDNPNNVETMKDRQFERYIANFYDKHPYKKILWVGHSYGGWLAIKSLLILRSRIPIENTSLVTIDPISRKKCTFFHLSGCSAALSDFSSDQFQTLSQLTSNWVNFYQRKTPIVRSTALPGAHRNIKLSTGHTKIDNDARVWSTITDLVSPI